MGREGTAGQSAIYCEHESMARPDPPQISSVRTNPITETTTVAARGASSEHQEPEAPDSCALSVVIPCRDAADTIAHTLDLLLVQELSVPWEIVVADNGSKDGTAHVVAEYSERHDNVLLIDASGPASAAFARNVGATAARGRSLVFFDADDLPEPDWLPAMGAALERDAFVGCRLDTESLNDKWMLAVRGRPQNSDLPLTSFHPHLPTASGGTIGIRASLFHELGGFDEAVPGGSEDVEFCLRGQLAGNRLVFVPDATVKMRYRHSRRGMFAQARRYASGHSILSGRFRDATVPDAVAPTAARAGCPRASESTTRKLGSMLIELGSRGGRARWIWRIGWYLGLADGYRDSRRRRQPPD